jgi:cytochrome c oxidase cbb3-type subunit III
MSRHEKRPVQDAMLDHDYDGIREFNNPAPGWLTTLFWASAVFAVAYMVWYGFNQGPSIDVAYLMESHDLERQWNDYYAHHPVAVPSAAELAAAATDPSVVELGRRQFQTSCSPCHGQAAQGLIGPNLTDDQWLHGGKMTEIYSTVVKGVPGKGMPPWGRSLSPEKTRSVVAWIRSAQGSSPPNAKAAEGTFVVPDPIGGRDP